MPLATSESSLCTVCHYPLTATHAGELVKCPYCGAINEAIAQVPTSTTALIAIGTFVLGVLIGPAFLVSTKAGQEWLEKQAKARYTK